MLAQTTRIEHRLRDGVPWAEKCPLPGEREQVVVAGGAFYRRPWSWHPRAFWFWPNQSFRR